MADQLRFAIERFLDLLERNPGRSTVIRRVYSNVCISNATVVILAVSYLLLHPSPLTPCDSPACLRTALYVQEYVDENLSPCEHYHDFVCGTYLQKTTGPSRDGTSETMKKRFYNALKRLLMEPKRNETSLPASFRSQRKFFKACTNTTALVEDSDRIFLDNVRYVVGSDWPALAVGTGKDNEWFEMTRRSRERGIGATFIDVELNGNFLNDTIDVELSPAKLQGYYDILMMLSNRARIVNMVNRLGGNWNDDGREIEDIFGFISELKSYVASPNIVRVTIGNLSSQLGVPDLDWPSFLKQITDLDSNVEVIYKFGFRDYLKNMQSSLRYYSKETVINFVALGILLDQCPYLSKTIRDECWEIVGAGGNRVDYCFADATNIYQGVLETQYIRETFTKQYRDHVHELISTIKEQFIVALNDTRWIEYHVKPLAIEHVRNLDVFVGAKDIFYDEKTFERQYGYGDINATNPIDVKLQANLISWKRLFAQITKPYREHLRFLQGWPDVHGSASYDYQKVNLNIFPALLAPPIYDPDRPEYLNFGSLGTIIAHELSHMFQTDLPARYLKPYMTSRTASLFAIEHRCVTNEYERYAAQMNITLINSEKTLHDSFSDFAAVNVAHEAYQRWAEKHDPEPYLIGVEYETKQLFWIMAAAHFCVTVSPMDDPFYFAFSDSDALDQFRIEGSAMNSPYFAPDFNCPAESRMNPKYKCEVLVPKHF